MILKVIHWLNGTENVHILISCREFDFQYDARFRALHAEEQVLTNPPWEAVQKLLESEGVSALGWPPEICNTLRTPQHLNFFLENLSNELKTPVFTSYQAMLDEVFTHRVQRVPSLGPKAVKACEKIASAMSESEELWIPWSAFDSDYGEEIDRLAGAGILKKKGLTIGFCHQTLFDYVRTRAFSRGTLSLAKHVVARHDAMFVRSTLWAGLHALRSTSPVRYHDEIGALWGHTNLRLHVRLMLITFLGRVSDPDLQEVGWLLPTLDDPLLRGKSLIAMIGNSGWFQRLASRLPALMSSSDEICLNLVSTLLAAALRFDRPTVFRVINHHWNSRYYDHKVLNAMRELPEWDDHAITLVEGILRRTPVACCYVVEFAKLATKSAPMLAPRLVGAALERSLVDAKEQDVGPAPVLEDDGSQYGRAVKLLRVRRHATNPIRELLREREWFGLEEIVSSAAFPLVKQIWPWFCQVAEILSREPSARLEQYRESDEIDLADGLDNNDLLRTLKSALAHYAVTDTDGFLGFSHESATSNLMMVHRTLAYGYHAIAATHPSPVVGYLTADPKRLSLGDSGNRHRETVMLISAVVPHLSAEDRKRLEDVIARWSYCRENPDDSAERAAEKGVWNRQHRLRLMRAFPADSLSPDSERFREQEEIALPETQDYDLRMVGSLMSSPMTADQMEKASDDEILSVLEEPSEWSGGNAAFSDFAKFAKRQPGRAMSLIEQFSRGKKEDAAGLAINAISELEAFDEDSVVGLIKRLNSKGFCSEEFRVWASWALANIADRKGGLEDTVCGMLREWLLPGTIENTTTEIEVPEEKQASLLWNNGFGFLPRGNFPVLLALLHGYLKREQPCFDDWLDVLEKHVDMEENIEVWRALARDLHLLGRAASIDRSARFVARLVDAFPHALCCQLGVMFVARSHRWLPEEVTHRCLKIIQESEWQLKGQAVGELAMLISAVMPQDSFCRSIVHDALKGTEGESKYLDQLRMGVAFAATHLWGNPRFRSAANAVLVRLTSFSDKHLMGAIMDVFRLTDKIPPDPFTGELLDGITRNPAMLQIDNHCFLADRLKELLADGFDPKQIAQVSKAILVASGRAIGDIRTHWARDARGLIEIALTLQRIKATRSEGLDLFEALLEQGAYEADKVLREIDRRPN